MPRKGYRAQSLAMLECESARLLEERFTLPGCLYATQSEAESSLLSISSSDVSNTGGLDDLLEDIKAEITRYQSLVILADEVLCLGRINTSQRPYIY